MTAVEALRSRPTQREIGASTTDLALAGVDRSLALGWIAVLPLVLMYEIACAAIPGSERNAAEYLLTLPIAGLMSRPELGRYVLEVAATTWALWSLFQGELGLVRRAARLVFEGLVAAVVLGPLLLVGLHFLDVTPPTIARPGAVPTLTMAALLVGGAAFEEIVFRVALIAALVYVARTTFEWWLGLPRTARVLAEGTALIGSAVLFAAAHLDAVVGLIVPGGEPYDAARFAWRATAGLALALLYRWRGMGVAAWCHAFFNLALALGAGPEMFL